MSSWTTLIRRVEFARMLNSRAGDLFGAVARRRKGAKEEARGEIWAGAGCAGRRVRSAAYYYTHQCVTDNSAQLNSGSISFLHMEHSETRSPQSRTKGLFFGALFLRPFFCWRPSVSAQERKKRRVRGESRTPSPKRSVGLQHSKP